MSVLMMMLKKGATTCLSPLASMHHQLGPVSIRRLGVPALCRWLCDARFLGPPSAYVRATVSRFLWGLRRYLSCLEPGALAPLRFMYQCSEWHLSQHVQCASTLRCLCSGASDLLLIDVCRDWRGMLSNQCFTMNVLMHWWWWPFL